MGRESESLGVLPDLFELHIRHSGLTPSLCRAWAEAASVCLSRHHRPPCEIVVAIDESRNSWRLSWKPAGERDRRAYANRDYATRDGAYSVALSALEAELGLVAVARAYTETGADFLVQPVGDEPDLESAVRLEVSGTDEGDEATVRERLRLKLRQLAAADAESRGYATVVGFAERFVLIREAEAGRAR